MKEIEVGEVFSETYKIMSRDWTFSIVGGVIVMVISAVGFALLIIPGIIVTPPLLCGYAYGLLRISRGEKVNVMDVFDGFNYFGPCLGAGLLCGLGLAVGFLLFIVPGIYLYMLWFLVPLLVMDRKLGATKALDESGRLVDGNKMNLFILNLLFCVAALAVDALSAGLGVFVTFPFGIILNVAVYNMLTDGETAMAETADSPA